MQSTIEDVSTVQKRVKIELQADQVNAAFNDAYREIQRKARIRGFRPGKAPLPMIKKMYGESVAADVADKLIKQHLFDAIDKNEIRPIASPSLESVTLPKQDEEYKFSALVDIMPTLELQNYKGLEVSFTKREVQEADIEAELKAIQKSHAKRKPAPEDALVASGLIATISHSATVEGEPFAGLTTENLAIEVGANQTLPEIDQALVGMKKLEQKQVEFKLSEDFPNKDLAGKQVIIDLTVNDLQESVLPELDDEFAKDLGLESIEQLKDNIRTHYNEQAERAKRSELERGLMEKILQNNPFDVPPAMVATVIDDMIDQMQWPNEEEKRRAKANQEFRQRFVEQAKQKAQNTLILWEVAKREKIEVTDEDVEKHIRNQFLRGAAATDEKNEKLVEQLRQSMGRNLKDNLIFEKSLDYLIDNANIKEINSKV